MSLQVPREREHRRNELQSHMPLESLLQGGELFQEARALTLPFGSLWQSFIVPRNQHPFFKEVASTDPSMQLNMCNGAVSELYLLANDVIFDPASKIEGI